MQVCYVGLLIRKNANFFITHEKDYLYRNGIFSSTVIVPKTSDPFAFVPLTECERLSE